MTTGEPTIEEYLRMRSNRLLRIAYLLTGDRRDAEDLVQTALVTLWPHWHRVVAAGDPDAYVRTTLINANLSQRRRRRPTEVLVPEWGERSSAGSADGLLGGGPGPDVAVTVEVETRLVVLRALQHLPPRQRATVVLRFYEDLTESQVAEIMNCRVGTVKSQTVKALRALRRELATQEGEGGDG